MTGDSGRGDTVHTHHHGGESTAEDNHGDGDKCRGAGGGNHNEMDSRHKGGVARDERSDQTRHVDDTHHESRYRSRAWGDDDAEGEGRSALDPVRHRDTRAHGDIYARGRDKDLP